MWKWGVPHTRDEHSAKRGQSLHTKIVLGTSVIANGLIILHYLICEFGIRVWEIDFGVFKHWYWAIQ